jgi:hypothetical protein
MREASVSPAVQTHIFGSAVEVSASGAGVGAFGRRCPNWDFLLLAELQGRVLTALAQKRFPLPKRVQIREIAQGHWLAVTRGRGMHTVFGGELGMGLPKRVDTQHNTSDAIVAYASGEYIAVQKTDLLRWTGERVAAPWDGDVPPSPTLWGQYALYSRWRAGVRTGMVWDATQGERALLAFPNMKVGRMVTDGADLAFVVESAQGQWLAGTPFSSSASALAPRKLASLGSNSGSPVVGCGMVALRMNDQTASIVRIRDGQTWTVTSREKCSLWCIDPLAIGCDELVAEVYGPKWTMVRIPLPALGSGKPQLASPMALSKTLSKTGT